MYVNNPNELTSAMGHRFDCDLRCSQMGCRTTWDDHQLDPQPCQGEDCVQRAVVQSSTELSKLCQRYGVRYLDIAKATGIPRTRVWRYLRSLPIRGGEEDIERTACQMLMARGVDVNAELGAA